MAKNPKSLLQRSLCSSTHQKTILSRWKSSRNAMVSKRVIDFFASFTNLCYRACHMRRISSCYVMQLQLRLTSALLVRNRRIQADICCNQGHSLRCLIKHKLQSDWAIQRYESQLALICTSLNHRSYSRVDSVR